MFWDPRREEVNEAMKSKQERLEEMVESLLDQGFSVKRIKELVEEKYTLEMMKRGRPAIYDKMGDVLF